MPPHPDRPARRGGVPRDAEARRDRTRVIGRPEQDPRYTDRSDRRDPRGRYDEPAGYAAAVEHPEHDGLAHEDAPRPTRGADRLERAPRRRHPVRRTLTAVVVVVALWLAGTVWAVVDSWNKVERTDAMPTWGDRPADTAGRNYLLVGSDSRENLSAEDRNRLRTGGGAGRRTDTIMLVHVPVLGAPSLISIPRDSYVPIRGMGENKINAAYNTGGAPLLIDTVEQNTGLRIDGYAEIGFGGFTNVVESLGGVELCPKQDIQDDKAHLDVKKGCQEMDGVTALAYVRARYFDPRGDLGRVERQREFLKAISSKALTPANVLLPWRLHSVGSAVTPNLTVDEHDSMLEIGMALNAVRRASGGDRQVTVPVSDSTLRTEHGWAVKWDDERAGELWKALREGGDLPDGL